MKGRHVKPLIKSHYLGLHGGTVAERLAFLPHSKKVLGSIPGPCPDFSVWSLHVPPCVWMGFLRGLRFPPSPNNMHYWSILQQVILTISMAVVLEMGPRAQLYAAAHCYLRIAPVALNDGLNAGDKFRCTLTNKDFYLYL